MIMAIFVCNYLNVNTLKLQQISLITKSIDTYNSSNLRNIILSFANKLRMFYKDS